MPQGGIADTRASGVGVCEDPVAVGFMGCDPSYQSSRYTRADPSAFDIASDQLSLKSGGDAAFCCGGLLVEIGLYDTETFNRCRISDLRDGRVEICEIALRLVPAHTGQSEAVANELGGELIHHSFAIRTEYYAAAG